MAEVMAGPEAGPRGSQAMQRRVQRSLILDSRGLPALLQGLVEVQRLATRKLHRNGVRAVRSDLLSRWPCSPLCIHIAAAGGCIC